MAKEEKNIPIVEPLESVVSTAVEESVESEPTTLVVDKPVTEKPVMHDASDIDDSKCWNCQTPLNKNFVCPKCGFDRKLVSNLRLEAKLREEKENATS